MKTLLEKQWDAFRQNMLPPVPPEMLPALRLSFYAGMLAIFEVWTNVPGFKAQIDRELDEFLKQEFPTARTNMHA